MESETSNPELQPSKLDFHEDWYTITIQVFIPFMIAGFGTVGAGIVLGIIENLEVFKHVNALSILIPSLIGLKGNLDMCLASRLCTQAHLGNMKVKRELIHMVIGNISVVQVQAIVSACLVALFATGVSALIYHDFDWWHLLVLATASVLTATITCFTLDLVLIAVIFVSYKLEINPDNVTAPFVASIGDVVTLLVLSQWARLLFAHVEYAIVISILCAYVFLVLPVWVTIVLRNTYTKEVIKHGWTPVLSALVISGLGGLVLDVAIDRFNGFVLFQPIINGIGGNLVSVQASRMATMLHKTSSKGVIPEGTKQCVWPWQALIYGVQPAKCARILLVMMVPGQTVFMFVVDVIHNEGVSCISVAFAGSYLVVSFVQIAVLLYVAHLMIHTMWKLEIEPDDSAVPYLTALGDLFGTSLLLLAFAFLHAIHQDYTPVKTVTG